MSQYEDLKKDIAELNRKLEIIMRSTSTAVIKDPGNGDVVTVAGALGRMVSLSRQIKDGAGCQGGCALVNKPVDPVENREA